jgi:large subunit ribosomal protein L17
MHDRSLIPSEHREAYEGMSDAARTRTLRMVSGRRYRTGDPKGRLAFTGQSVTHRLIEKIAPRYEDRPGGYTRVILLPDRRIGDHSQLAILQLVGDEESPGTLTRAAKTSRKKRADGRYALAIRLSKKGGKGASKGSQKTAPAPEAEVDSADTGEAPGSEE